MSFAAQNVYYLRQGLDLLARLDDRLFTTPVRQGGSSGVGGHLRHCIDYYQCFLRDLPEGRIDYDRRDRDGRIEREPRQAARAIEAILDGLARIDPAQALEPIAVRVDAAAWETGEESWSRSTLARELQFLLSHTVHHYALIAFLLRCLDFEPGPQFGVAPSTLEHRARLEGSGAVTAGEPVALCAR